ncbi:hypothetical protein [Haladaptatus sp. NG-SE-30]
MNPATKGLTSGLLAFVVAASVASVAGGRKQGFKIGILTGGSVAVSVWFSERRS